MNTTTLRDIEIRSEVKLHSDGKTLFNGESTLPLPPLHNSNLTMWNENFMYPSIEFAQPFYRRSNFSERSISRPHRLHVIQMCMGRKQVRLLLLKSNYACCKFSGRKRAYLSSFLLLFLDPVLYPSYIYLYSRYYRSFLKMIIRLCH